LVAQKITAPSVRRHAVSLSRVFDQTEKAPGVSGGTFVGRTWKQMDKPRRPYAEVKAESDAFNVEYVRRRLEERAEKVKLRMVLELWEPEGKSN
jgi:hypothetical protein